MIRLKKMYGVSMGIVTWRNLCHQFAPSISAASYRCCGMPCNPASHRIIPPPAPQSPMMTNAGLANSSLVNHVGAASPNHSVSVARQAALISPNSGFSTHSHRMALATTGTMEGRK